MTANNTCFYSGAVCKFAKVKFTIAKLGNMANVTLGVMKSHVFKKKLVA